MKTNETSLSPIECLCCGTVRQVPNVHTDSGECSSCGSMGWEFPEALTEIHRRALRASSRASLARFRTA
jgi:hypothetical protein